jgi:protein SCO1/2
MRTRHFSIVAAALCTLLVAVQNSPLRADTAKPQIGISERLGHTLPRDAQFYDESGHLVTLGSLIDKPTIITFVYFRCPGICTPLLTELSKMVNKMSLDLGKDYRIVTISFDASETPDIATEKKENYLGAITKKVDPNGWRFLTGDSATIRRVTDSAGFYFSRVGKDWVHPATLIVVSPEGEITRYITGIQYLPLDLTMAIYEASKGTVSPTISTVLRFCYAYDPQGKTYSLNVLRISIVSIMLVAGVFALVFLRKKKPKSPIER